MARVRTAARSIAISTTTRVVTATALAAAVRSQITRRVPRVRWAQAATSALGKRGTTATRAMAQGRVMRRAPPIAMSSIPRVATATATVGVRFRTTARTRSALVVYRISAVGRRITVRTTATARAPATTRAPTTAMRWIRPAATTTATRIRRRAATAPHRLRASSVRASTAVAARRSRRSIATARAAAAMAVAAPTVATHRRRSGARVATVFRAAPRTATAVVAVPASTAYAGPKMDVKAPAMTRQTVTPTGASTAGQTDASRIAVESTATRNTVSPLSVDVAHTMRTTTASHTTPATTASQSRQTNRIGTHGTVTSLL